MTAFDNGNKLLKTALESDPSLHLSKALIDEALNIHASKNIGATETQIASQMEKDPTHWMQIHKGLETALSGEQAKKDPQFAASIYRDIAVMDQAAAFQFLHTDPAASGIMLGKDGLNDPFNAKNALAKAEQLDPANKDLPELHLFQNDLARLVWHNKD